MGLVDRAQNQMHHRSRCRDCGGRGRVHWDHVCPFCRDNDERVIGIVHVQRVTSALIEKSVLLYDEVAAIGKDTHVENNH
jgi:hypothetical protein